MTSQTPARPAPSACLRAATTQLGPWRAFDPELVEEILDTTLVPAGDRTAKICVTHEAVFAGQVADRIVFIAAGAVAEKAPPDEFLAAPRPALTRTVLAQLLHRTSRQLLPNHRKAPFDEDRRRRTLHHASAADAELDLRFHA